MEARVRVLLVAEPGSAVEAWRDLVRAAGHEVAGVTTPIEVSGAVRRRSAEAVLCGVAGDSRALRRLVERVRHAAEAPLPVVLLLPDDAHWLRTGAPVDLAPLAVLPEAALDAADLQRALDWLGDGPRRREPAWPLGRGVAFDRSARELRGERASQRLTPSEAVILGLLLDAPGRTVDTRTLTLALWRSSEVDRFARAAIRSHVHTLRKKLASVGLEGALASDPRVGYRWLAPPPAVEVSGPPPRPPARGRTVEDPARPSRGSASAAAPRTPGAAPR
jgi:DNA-binding response OmpR family regulator